MILRLFIVIIFSWFSLGFTQELVFEKELKVSSKSMKVDGLGNVYLINDYNIYKLSPKGDTINVFSTKKYGAISELDITIPQKPLILYKEAGILLELDFTLSENSAPINLYQENLINPQFVIHSPLTNGYWVYDASKYELMHYDKNFKLDVSSGNLLQLTSLKDFKPKGLIFHDNKVYLSSEKNGVLVFDQFTTYLKKIPLFDFDNFFVENSSFVYTKADSLYISDPLLINVSSIKMEETALKICVKKMRAYFLSTKGIKIYKLEPNEDK